MTAVANKRLDLVKEALRQGADLNYQDNVSIVYNIIMLNSIHAFVHLLGWLHSTT